MARLLGLHEVELRPEVDPAEYERVFATEVAASAAPPGMTAHLLKGERGVRAGKLMWLFELEDAELLYRYFPQPDESSEELLRFLAEHPESAAAWDKLHSLEVAGSDTVTDYVVVVE